MDLVPRRGGARGLPDRLAVAAPARRRWRRARRCSCTRPRAAWARRRSRWRGSWGRRPSARCAGPRRPARCTGLGAEAIVTARRPLRRRGARGHRRARRRRDPGPGGRAPTGPRTCARSRAWAASRSWGWWAARAPRSTSPPCCALQATILAQHPARAHARGEGGPGRRLRRVGRAAPGRRPPAAGRRPGPAAGRRRRGAPGRGPRRDGREGGADGATEPAGGCDTVALRPSTEARNGRNEEAAGAARARGTRVLAGQGPARRRAGRVRLHRGPAGRRGRDPGPPRPRPRPRVGLRLADAQAERSARSSPSCASRPRPSASGCATSSPAWRPGLTRPPRATRPAPTRSSSTSTSTTRARRTRLSLVACHGRPPVLRDGPRAPGGRERRRPGARRACSCGRSAPPCSGPPPQLVWIGPGGPRAPRTRRAGLALSARSAVEIAGATRRAEAVALIEPPRPAADGG